jgi:hypothetical protein
VLLRQGRFAQWLTKGWQRKFEDPVPLSGGRKLVTLRDAADYITCLPKKGVRGAGMASRDRGADAGGRTEWTDHVCSDWHHASIEPRTRSGV